MKNMRFWLADRLARIPVPYEIGKRNVLANLKWMLFEVIVP